jgi:hypothetical protein
VFLRAILGHGDHAAANGEVPVGVVGIEDRQRHTGALPHVAILHPALGGVDQDEIAIGVDPDGRDLRLAAGRDGRQMAWRRSISGSTDTRTAGRAKSA